MFRTLRTVLLMTAGLAVLVRLLDAWSDARLTPTPPAPTRGPAPDERVRAAEEAVRALTLTLAELAPTAEATGPEGVAGTFAVTGDAAGDDHVAWTPVAFGAPLPSAPAGWGREDGQAWPPGTIVLEVTETDNCTTDDVAVEFATDRAPTADGFTVRVACAGPGPYAARGAYRVV